MPMNLELEAFSDSKFQPTNRLVRLVTVLTSRRAFCESKAPLAERTDFADGEWKIKI